MSAPTDPRREPAEHGEWDALAVGWALSALDPEDEERFAAHLPGCAQCTATVRESLYTVADLAYALPDEAPPPSMKARLMAAVAAEPRPAASPSGGSAGSAGSAALYEQWPLGEPHPGSPGYNTDWFAKLATDDPAAAQPAADGADGGRAAGGAAGGAAAGGASGGAAARTVAQGAAAGGNAEGPAQPGADGLAGGPAHRSAGGPAQPAAGSHATPARPADGVLDEHPAQPAAGGAGRPAPVELGSVRSAQGIRRDEVGGRQAVGPGDPVVVPMDPHRRRRRVLTGVAAAAVVALIAALGAWNLNLRSEQDELRQVVAQREAAIQQLTANGPARVAALTQDGQPSPTRKATLVVRGDRVEIIVETLGATPADRTYWLWTLRCDNGKAADPKPVHGFTVTQPAFSVRTIGSDADAATATCFAISSEPGTATPTEPHDVQAIGQPSN